MMMTLSKRGIVFVLVIVVSLWQYGVVRHSFPSKQNQQTQIKAFIPRNDDDETFTTEEDLEHDSSAEYVHPSTVKDDDFIQEWADDDGLLREFDFLLKPKKNQTKSSKQKDSIKQHNETETIIENGSNNTATNRTYAMKSNVTMAPSQKSKTNTSSTLTDKLFNNKYHGHHSHEKEERYDRSNNSKEPHKEDEFDDEEEDKTNTKKKMMEPYLIAWYSAGVFVLLGLPISLYGIIMHLTHYNQPHIQVYIVRILWMVPIYSMESWLCLRYHAHAIYIETLRDFYESYVLYSFLQFLIQVLGGEEELILMLKDKSPTRGFHMWGMQYCLRPWLMGQPVSRLEVCSPSATNLRKSFNKNDDDDTYNNDDDDDDEEETKPILGSSSSPNASFDAESVSNSSVATNTTNTVLLSASENYHRKRVQWTSPFFVKCKFGVLQYVVSKFVLSIITMILELSGVYKEGNFTWKGGYLYVCILTNLSQCWALYCLILFYFATVTELSPIRPVGKFLSVKAIVFFTWWQSVCISFIYQANLIPHYHGNDDNDDGSYSPHHDWTPEDVAKGLQDYLICIEMLIASFVHIAVFPHKDYLPHAVKARNAQHEQMMQLLQRRRVQVGRLHHQQQQQQNTTTANELSDVSSPQRQSSLTAQRQQQLVLAEEFDVNDHISEGALIAAMHAKEDFLRAQKDTSQIGNLVEAFLDSTAAIPSDLIENSAGIIRGEYNQGNAKFKQTLLHHAATSDSHDLFTASRLSSSSSQGGQNMTNMRSSLGGRRRKTTTTTNITPKES